MGPHDQYRTTQHELKCLNCLDCRSSRKTWNISTMSSSKKWIQLKTNNPGPPAPPPPGFNIIRPPPPPLVRFPIFVIITVFSNPIMSSQPYLCQQAYFFHPICFGKHESLDGRMHSSGPRSCGSGSAQWSPLTRKNILWMLNMILRKLVSAKLNISPHRKSVKSKCAVQRNLTWWLWKSEQSPGAWNAAYGMAGYHKQCKIYKCRRHSGEIWRVGPTMQISVKWDHNLATDHSSTIPPPVPPLQSVPQSFGHKKILISWWGLFITSDFG